MTDSDVLNTRIRELIKNREWAVLRELLSGLPAPDIAAVLPVTEKHEQVLFCVFCRSILRRNSFPISKRKTRTCCEEARNVSLPGFRVVRCSEVADIFCYTLNERQPLSTLLLEGNQKA